jgi:serine/threonine protein kinase
MDCGYLLQAETAVGEMEGAPALCPNPACGVANPPSERYCQRCSTPLPTPPGTILHGRYKIERLLAMGGFGAVYLAIDLKNDNRPVAIKDMICQDSQEFAIRLNFFRREAEILKSLDSVPIVPRVYDLIEQGQTAHLVLEFIRGNDLLKIMEANGNEPFPLAQVVEWGRNICDVLGHMHGQSPPLVHRDLKPENVMLLEDKRSIKMIDFGTARDLGRTQREKMAAKTRVYTEGYAPPEQIVGKPEPRSDLFALAGTMYHLATGKAPEGHYTADELKANLADPNGYPADQRWFWELVKINLSEDVNERYFSAREIKADLEKGQITRETICPQCRTANKVREYPYCQKCGEPLTDPTPPCHHCGKSNRMGSRCCIHCGNRLR